MKILTWLVCGNENVEDSSPGWVTLLTVGAVLYLLVTM